MIFKLIVFVTIIVQSICTDRHNISSRQFSAITCLRPSNGEHLCYCGSNSQIYDRLKGETCVRGRVVRNRNTVTSKSGSVLRPVPTPIHRSLRDDYDGAPIVGLFSKRNMGETVEQLVPLRRISVEANIDGFAADVTINQVFFNEELTDIEAIYVFPIEENAAVYSFTAQIDDRTIVAELKEKNTAEKEYQDAIAQGQTAVLLRQSEQTLDTFTINVGSLAPGKTCVITIKYVSELEMVDGNSIRFVVPTTISPRYNPSLGQRQSPDATPTKYMQKTPYSLSYRAHIVRSKQYDFKRVANLSHPVEAMLNKNSIDISMSSVALDRDIILDIDLPENRPNTLVRVERDPETSTMGVLFAFIPHSSDFKRISGQKKQDNTEFIFLVDCSGSMSGENQMQLATDAMIFLLKSLPLNSRFNIIRFGSTYELLFKTRTMTTIYNEATANKAQNFIQTMQADLGYIDLLGVLTYLQEHPPARGLSRQVFLLTSGDIFNTDEVIKVAQSMASSTRIFSIGLGDSSSRSLIKGVARATNGYYTFIPPNAQVDRYIASQFSRALQPSIVGAHLEWHGVEEVGQQAPTVIPPLYVDDRVLVYQLFDQEHLSDEGISVDVMVGTQLLYSLEMPAMARKSPTMIRRLAAKALIQELQHSESGRATEQTITKLSLDYQILSPYTAFVGVERDESMGEHQVPIVRYIPIQVHKNERPKIQYQSIMPSDRFGMDTGSGDSNSHKNVAVAFDSTVELSDAEISATATTTTTVMPDKSQDLVRWLIDRQSFNGEWILNDQDISRITNGKSLNAFHILGNSNRDIATTALAIAIFESKYAEKMRVWEAFVTKARLQLQQMGLTQVQIDEIINQFKLQI